jgi:hypothetical protein
VLGESLGAAQRSLELANSRYQEGYADFQRVLDAQRALFAQAEGELLNHGEHISSVIELYRAIGGGWLDMPIAEIVPAKDRETMESRTGWGDLLSAPLPLAPDNPSTAAGHSP